jgi:hypothetical protein
VQYIRNGELRVAERRIRARVHALIGSFHGLDHPVLVVVHHAVQKYRVARVEEEAFVQLNSAGLLVAAQEQLLVYMTTVYEHYYLVG